MAIDRTGITSLNTGAGEITYSGNQGPKSPDQQLMAMADPMIVEMYEQYVFEMEEQGMRPMPFRDFMEQIIAESKMAKGGRVGYQGGQLVRPPGITDEEWERMMFGIKGPRPLSSQSPYLSVHAYGGMANPTYTQKRKQNLAYGGIAGVDGRKRYGIGSWFQGIKDKFVDDIIPNEIKDNPILSSVAAGALLNQFGIPFTGTPGDRMGQNWLGDLLGGKDLVLGPGGEGTVSPNPVGGLDQLAKNIGITGTEGVYTGTGDGGEDKSSLLNTILTGATALPGKIGDIATDITGAITGSKFANWLGTPSDIGGQQVNWKQPLAIGLGIGALDKATRKDESLPAQPGIDIANIRSRALTGSDPNLKFLPPASATTAYAQGGRIGAQEGGLMASAPDPMDEAFQMYKDAIKKGLFNGTFDDFLEKIDEMRDSDKTSAVPRMMAQEGGLINLGGMEKDYRNEGGFVPIGGQERADDVPARLSKNEFVFTADAVRSAGGGDIDKGAEVMENVMKNLEQGGQVSEESQGLEGARNMFATAQKLEGVM
jgi:hypothetical protein